MLDKRQNNEVLCDWCGGTGIEHGQRVQCFVCLGSGYVDERFSVSYGECFGMEECEDVTDE